MSHLQTRNYSSLKAKREALNAFKADCLAVVRVGFLAANRNLLSPVVQVDAAGRPDLHDLARVHRSEGGFDTRARWDFCLSQGMTGLGRLTIDIDRPVKTSFKILFQLQKYSDYLAALADDFSFVSVKFDYSPMEDVISYHFDQASLKQGVNLYRATQLFIKTAKGGR